MLIFCLGLAVAPAMAQQKAFVANALTGVALSGYDPVAYFTEDQPRMGSPLYAHEWGDTVWYFSSAANRDAFAADPEIYAPLFGGHCVTAMARGYLSDGNPQLYRIVGDRLLLFHSIGNRAAFGLAAASQLSTALDNWDALPDYRAQTAIAQ